MTEPTRLLEFPCDFAIKVMGLSSPELEATVLALIQGHVTTLDNDAIKSRPSKKGKYTALTVTINATSQKQLDAIYQALSNCDAILMAL
ncbi:MAG: DUF493 domain-containing protein [Methylococcales bacterium]|jgi:hypothetical protein|nr:DUF493 domain-containing protein [Methylococcales bacterium]